MGSIGERGDANLHLDGDAGLHLDGDAGPHLDGDAGPHLDGDANLPLRERLPAAGESVRRSCFPLQEALRTGKQNE